MSEIAFEVVFVLLLVLANGLFAMSEMAVVSSRRARLQQRADAGDAGAQAALELADNPNRFLSTVQIGITLIGILAGAVGGAGISATIAGYVAGAPALAPYAQTIGLAVVVSAIGYLSLVLGELAPKRIALGGPERIASLVARPMRALSAVASPAVRLLSVSTDAVVRLVGAREAHGPPVTEQEIRILIRQGTEAGVFEASEQEMVERIFHLGDRRVASLMTPRPDVVWLDAGAPPERVLVTLDGRRLSRVPVCEGGLDRVLGIVRAKDLLVNLLNGAPLDLRAAAVKPLFIPESATALKALELLKAARVHVALVVDEYGSVQGMITHHDLLEAIVGDLPSADRDLDPQLVRREDGSWLVDGMLPIEDFIDALELERNGDALRGPYHTVAGLVIARLGRLPKVGDRLEWGTLGFEVLDLDGRRVDRVLVTPIEPGRREP